MLRADTDRPKPQNGTYLWVTAGETYFSCLPSLVNGTGEGFFAITKEGTKYWFNHLVYLTADTLQKPLWRPPLRVSKGSNRWLTTSLFRPHPRRPW